LWIFSRNIRNGTISGMAQPGIANTIVGNHGAKRSINCVGRKLEEYADTGSKHAANQSGQ
jgi:hypothetical protein